MLDVSKGPGRWEEREFPQPGGAAEGPDARSLRADQRPDEGIAQDYPAYRDAHRDVLHAYIEKHVVREKKK
jgi:hypothetical protein